MPPDSLVLILKFVQGGTNAKPENVSGNAKNRTADKQSRNI